MMKEHLDKLEKRQHELLTIIRQLASADDCDSADLVDLALELRANDDLINITLEKGRTGWEAWHDEQGFDYCESCDDYGHLSEDCPEGR